MGMRMRVVVCGRRQTELRRRDASAQHAFRGDLSASDRKAPQRSAQTFERQPEIEKRA